MLQEDGTTVERSRGTPQGGVVSPILANLFMHYAFDAWMARRFPDLPWCRYADDGLVHCRSMKSVNQASRLRCLPLPGKPLRRTMMLAMRQEEGEAIAPAIRQATSDLLRDVFLPEARQLFPEIARQIVIGPALAKPEPKVRPVHFN
jgi:hypothetical protein